jgi:uncharacterized membrane protein (UPF0127 family)
MQNLKNHLFLMLGIIIIAGSFYFVLQQPAPERYQIASSQQKSESTLKFDNKTIVVEVADTDEERSLGLSGRESLPYGHGLLFLFPEAGNYGFWMKDMRFPIDIVWIDEAWQVIGVERGVSPDTFPQAFYPPAPVKYVLELAAGSAADLVLDTGTLVYFDNPN